MEQSQGLNRTNLFAGVLGVAGFAGGAYLLGSAIKRIYDGVPMQELRNIAGLAKHKAVLLKAAGGAALTTASIVIPVLTIRASRNRGQGKGPTGTGGPDGAGQGGPTVASTDSADQDGQGGPAATGTGGTGGAGQDGLTATSVDRAGQDNQDGGPTATNTDGVGGAAVNSDEDDDSSTSASGTATPTSSTPPQQRKADTAPPRLGGRDISSDWDHNDLDDFSTMDWSQIK